MQTCCAGGRQARSLQRAGVRASEQSASRPADPRDVAALMKSSCVGSPAALARPGPWRRHSALSAAPRAAARQAPRARRCADGGLGRASAGAPAPPNRHRLLFEVPTVPSARQRAAHGQQPERVRAARRGLRQRRMHAPQGRAVEAEAHVRQHARATARASPARRSWVPFAGPRWHRRPVPGAWVAAAGRGGQRDALPKRGRRRQQAGGLACTRAQASSSQASGPMTPTRSVRPWRVPPARGHAQPAAAAAPHGVLRQERQRMRRPQARRARACSVATTAVANSAPSASAKRRYTTSPYTSAGRPCRNGGPRSQPKALALTLTPACEHLPASDRRRPRAWSCMRSAAGLQGAQQLLALAAHQLLC